MKSSSYAKSVRRNGRSPRFERLEDRHMLTAIGTFSGSFDGVYEDTPFVGPLQFPPAVVAAPRFQQISSARSLVTKLENDSNYDENAPFVGPLLTPSVVRNSPETEQQTVAQPYRPNSRQAFGPIQTLPEVTVTSEDVQSSHDGTLSHGSFFIRQLTDRVDIFNTQSGTSTFDAGEFAVEDDGPDGLIRQTITGRSRTGELRRTADGDVINMRSSIDLYSRQFLPGTLKPWEGEVYSANATLSAAQLNGGVVTRTLSAERPQVAQVLLINEFSINMESPRTGMLSMNYALDAGTRSTVTFGVSTSRVPLIGGARNYQPEFSESFSAGSGNVLLTLDPRTENDQNRTNVDVLIAILLQVPAEMQGFSAPEAANLNISWSVAASSDVPNVAVLDAAFADENAITFDYEIEEGSTQSSVPIEVALYASTDNTFSQDDVRLDQMVIESEAGTGTGTFTSVAPLTQDQAFYLVVADPDELLEESNENDNEAFLAGPIEFDIVVTTFIPAPFVPDATAGLRGLPTELLPALVNSGDDRSFDPDSDRYRTRQSVTLIANESADSDGLKDGTKLNEINSSKSFTLDALDDGVLDERDEDGVLGDFHLQHGESDNLSGRKGMIIDDPIRLGPNEVQIRMRTDSNPLEGPRDELIPGSPTIDWDLTITIDASQDTPTATIQGTWDGFPALEVYVNGSELWTYTPGNGPYGIFELFNLLPVQGDIQIPQTTQPVIRKNDGPSILQATANVESQPVPNTELPISPLERIHHAGLATINKSLLRRTEYKSYTIYPEKDQFSDAVEPTSTEVNTYFRHDKHRSIRKNNFRLTRPKSDHELTENIEEQIVPSRFVDAASALTQKLSLRSRI